AAAGKGEDVAKLGAKEKARLRQQAHDWLHDVLKLYTGQLEDLDARNNTALQKMLQRWQQDADLASVREPKELAKRPEPELTAWQQLWADVETLRKKASKSSP